MILFSQRVKLANEYQEWANRPLPDGVRIKDCPESVISFLQGKGMLFKSEEIAALRAEVERLRAEASAWVDVDDRLPNPLEQDWVLVKTKLVPEGWYGVPHIAELRNGVWHSTEYDTPLEGTASVKVTHWMPIPNPQIEARAALGREATHGTETP